MSPEPLRPDPDRLLAAVQREQARARRGRLKIFFGMCPGVGKTYAMLREAQARAASGVEVLVGLVETHGRRETEALLEGLPLVPRARVEYRGAVLEEMDLDAILAWHPPLVLVDELAHTNAPGSRHPKRYQDVLELLDAGIDVLTTVNVQHIESRRDAVQAITGAPVRETVPDSVLDVADEIVLVDLTPDQLRARLAEGKVYLGARAAAAGENFFREGNLLALREMALRLVAEHVDRDLRASAPERAASGAQPGHRLLVAVSASPTSEALLRYTRQLASSLEGTWVALHVQGAHSLPEAEDARLQQHLALARQLGAEVISTAAVEVGEAILRVARQQQVSQLVLGKPEARPWPWSPRSPVDWLLRHSGELQLHLVRPPSAQLSSSAETVAKGPPLPWGEFVTVSGLAAAITAAGWWMEPLIGYRAVALLYLLVVVLASIGLRRGPVLVLAASSALLWNYLFIPPRFTFAIREFHDWFAFGLFFVVALITGHFHTRLREREWAERQAERRATSLLRITQALAHPRDLPAAIHAVMKQLQDHWQARGAILLRDADGLTAQSGSTFTLTPKEESVAAWAFQRKQPAGRFTDTLPGSDAFHLPLLAGERPLGVLVVALPGLLTVEGRELLTTLAAQFAAVIQRFEAERITRDQQLAADAQRLQKALFDSVSHELKTPLATLSGMLDQPAPDATEMRTAVHRLTGTVDLLLDATRLESGLLRPSLEWCDPLELAQDAARRAGFPADRLRVTAAHGLPTVRVDGGLISQALVLLLGNALAHTPPEALVELHAAHDGGHVILSVLDRGPGIPPGLEEKIFTKFYRGPTARPGGLGLGLAIARQLAELHGGTLHAQNRPGGGAIFALRLPAQEVMRLPEELSA